MWGNDNVPSDKVFTAKSSAVIDKCEELERVRLNHKVIEVNKQCRFTSIPMNSEIVVPLFQGY